MIIVGMPPQHQWDGSRSAHSLHPFRLQLAFEEAILKPASLFAIRLGRPVLAHVPEPQNDDAIAGQFVAQFVVADGDPADLAR